MYLSASSVKSALSVILLSVAFSGCNQPADLVINNNQPVTETNTNSAAVAVEETPLPDNLNLSIPFQSQAPFSNWDEPYQNACEEASIILAVNYLKGETEITKTEMDQEILAMVKWQENNWGGHYDLTAEQTINLLENYYPNFSGEVIYDFAWNDVKQALADNHPVIVPTQGQELDNPNFTPPGPEYHMLVIKGYNPNQVITNDVGTRKGADYRYNYDTLYNAVHDWNDGDVKNGRKAMIIVQ